jgi:hypothetical protein
MRGVETGPIREMGAILPVAVAGRVEGFICGDFLVEPAPAMRVGAARTACPRFEGTAGCFRGFEFAIVAARARYAVPFVTCPAVELGFEASPPRSRAKGVESSVNVKVR